MSKVMPELKYTETHEWLKVEGDVALMGITDYAQHAMGDLVYVELPDEGDEAKAGEELVVAESVKGANEVFSPICGEVVEVNEELEDAPENVNEDAYAAWMVKIKIADMAQVEKLMDAAAYEELLKKEEA